MPLFVHTGSYAELGRDGKSVAFAGGLVHYRCILVSLFAFELWRYVSGTVSVRFIAQDALSIRCGEVLGVCAYELLQDD
jgi:hypothetical protein